MDDTTPTVDAPSKPPERFRRTRIAVSVFFGAMAVALCALWWWSYWRSYAISYTDTATTAIGASNGVTYVIHLGRRHYHSVVPGTRNSGWRFQSQPAFYANAEFPWTRFGGLTQLKIPIWFLTALSVAATVVPWIRICRAPLSPRFSLRTMLIATTMVALVLGLVCYAFR